MARRLIQQIAAHAIAVACTLGVVAVASAQSLPDPTRPPSGFVESSGSGGIGSAAAMKEAISVEAAAASGPQLQSVVLPQNGRPVAIISGKYVPQGERFGGMELISITQQEVVLAAGKNRRVLKLTPGVEKTAPAAAKAEPPGVRRKVVAGRQEKQRVIRGGLNDK